MNEGKLKTGTVHAVKPLRMEQLQAWGYSPKEAALIAKLATNLLEQRQAPAHEVRAGDVQDLEGLPTKA